VAVTTVYEKRKPFKQYKQLSTLNKLATLPSYNRQNLPCAQRTTVDTQASKVIVKSAVHTLVGRADAFTPYKVQGTFYILKGKWGNRIILVSPSPLFNKQICISGMVAPRACSFSARPFVHKNCFIQSLQMSRAVFTCLSCDHPPWGHVLWHAPPPIHYLPVRVTVLPWFFLLGFNRNNNGP